MERASRSDGVNGVGQAVFPSELSSPKILTIDENLDFARFYIRCMVLKAEGESLPRFFQGIISHAFQFARVLHNRTYTQKPIELGEDYFLPV